MNQGRMIILVGPSGVGKSTLLEMALKDFSWLRDVITYTTRQPRSGESEGQPYHFVSREKFDRLIEQDFFIEWAEVHGNRYGTPHDQVRRAFLEKKGVIMDVDVQGARVIKDRYPQAMTVFILPPSIDSLRHRLSIRDGGKTKDIEVRLNNAKREMEQKGLFDHQIVNENLPDAYAQLKKMIEEMA